MIKYKGYQVAPAELEALLYEHPAVLDVAVIPKPDEAGGEAPKACIVRRPGVGGDARGDHGVRGRAGWRPTRRSATSSSWSPIPKTASGKILRRDLIQRERAKLNG